MFVSLVFPQNQVVELLRVPSTNKYVEEIISKQNIPEGSIYYTFDQTAGIGQAENKWESEPGKNLTATMVVYPDFLLASEQFFLTIVASLSVSDAVNGYLHGISSQIKWPNDIYVQHQKIAGILIKNFVTGDLLSATIIGLGLNINQVHFKEAPDAISLKILTDTEFSINEVLTNWHDKFAFYYDKLKKNRNEILDLYLSRMYMRGVAANYLVGDKIVNATITGVDKYGFLVLNDSKGKKYVCGNKEIVYPPMR